VVAELELDALDLAPGFNLIDQRCLLSLWRNDALLSFPAGS